MEKTRISPHLHLLLNIAGSVLSRSINLISVAITVPLALKGLKHEDYATYATMLSFLVFFGFSDLGIGSSIVNPVSSATDSKSISRARSVLTQAWVVQISIGLLIIFCGTALTLLVSTFWFGEDRLSAGTLNWIAMFLSVGIGMIVGIGQRILFSLRRNLEANVWLIMGRALSVLAVYLCYVSGAGVFGYILSSQLVPHVISLCLIIYLFMIDRKDLCPKLSLFVWHKAFALVKTGLLFLVLSFSVFCEIGIDNILLGVSVPPEIVTQYDVTTKPLFYICSLSGIVLFPIWPHLSQELAAGRHPSWKSVRRVFLVFTFVMVMGCFIIWGLLNNILNIWIGDFQPLDRGTTFIVALNTVFIAIGMLQSMMLNAKDKIKAQTKIQILFILTVLPWKLVLGYFWGPLGIALALATAYLPRLFYVHFKLIVPNFKDSRVVSR